MAYWLASITTMTACWWWCTTQSRRAAVLWMLAVVILLFTFYQPGALEGAFASFAGRVEGWASLGFSEIAKEGASLAK